MTSNHHERPIDLVDTNIFIRYLTEDHEDHSARAYRLFQAVGRGERVVTTTEGVLVEVVQVLSSKALYNLPRTKIRQELGRVLALVGFVLPHEATYLRALDLYGASNLDFVDCLNIAHLERATFNAILSFDRGYDRIDATLRREP
ncbi:MAG: PIN domain-containing protein [Thermomicrobiales bacterium]